MRTQRRARRPLARAMSATALFVGLLAGVPGPAPSAAQTGAGAWTITAFAGTGQSGFSGDGGPATSAQLQAATAVAADDQGNLYITDRQAPRVRKVDASGTITTVAGTGVRGSTGDGGPATSARLDPFDLAVDRAGNLLIADVSGHRIRKVGADGIITTVAGTGTRGFSGDGGPATSAQIAAIGVEVDDNGNLFIASVDRLRKVGADGIITTVAGTGTRGFSGDGGPATSAQVNVARVGVDSSGNLYLLGGERLRKIDTAGIITTIAGTGTRGFSGDGGPGTSAQLNFSTALEVQGSGNVFIADRNNGVIRRVDASGIIHTVAGSRPLFGSHGDGGFAPFAGLRSPQGVTLDGAGNLYIADTGNHRIRRVETSHLWISSAPKQSKAGESFTYTLNVSGLPATATGVALTAALAPEVAFTGVTASQGSCANNAGTVSCQLGTIEPGAAATVDITVNAQRGALVPITGTVSSQPEVIPGNRSVTAFTRVSAANCGQTITANTVLSEDIGPCTGNGVVFGSDNVTLDLGGKRIFGFAGPGDGREAGVRITNRSGVTVTNGTVSDFDAGVAVEGGGSNTVSRLAIRDNVSADDIASDLGDGVVLIRSAGNIVANNVITNSGIYDGVGVLGIGSNNNTIEGNTIETTGGPFQRGIPNGQGIIVNAATFGELTAEVVTGTKITRNVIRDSASGGIANINSVDGEILLNTVENNGYRQTFGHGIGLQLGPGRPTPVTNMLIQGNEVHGNALNGILVRATSDNNRILNNNAANNGRVDLVDLHPDCANNVWRNNAWGTGGFSAECVTVGGKGPRSRAKGTAADPAEARELPQRGKPDPRNVNETGELGAP